MDRNIIMFEQNGDDLLEGKLSCGQCGYRGHVYISEYFKHVYKMCISR